MYMFLHTCTHTYIHIHTYDIHIYIHMYICTHTRLNTRSFVPRAFNALDVFVVTLVTVLALSISADRDTSYILHLACYASRFLMFALARCISTSLIGARFVYKLSWCYYAQWPLPLLFRASFMLFLWFRSFVSYLRYTTLCSTVWRADSAM